MSDIDFKLLHAVNAAVGWLELGNKAEARAELDALPASSRTNPEVLELLWVLHASDHDWEGGLKIAEQLVAIAPDNCGGWLHRAYAMRRVPHGGLQQAAAILRPAFEKFPDETTIPFNLACYECQLGNLPEARKWLIQARERANKKEIKAMALADKDLEPLWPEIRNW